MLYLLESSLLSLMLFFIWRMNSHFAAAKCHKTDRKRHEMHKIRGFGGGHVKLCSAGRSDTVHRTVACIFLNKIIHIARVWVAQQKCSHIISN